MLVMKNTHNIKHLYGKKERKKKEVKATSEFVINDQKAKKRQTQKSQNGKRRHKTNHKMKLLLPFK